MSMSQGSEQEEPQDQVTDEVVETPDSDDSGTGINPAWNELLESVPSSLHSQITPHLSKWDKNYQDGIQKVHSQYEPYKSFVENQIQPDQINYALSIMQALEEKPEEMLKALQAWIGEEEETEEQGLENQTGFEESPDFMQHPEFQRLQGLTQTMAQLLMSQKQQEEEALLDKEIDDELKRLQEDESLGGFDEEWVIQKAAYSDMSLEDAAKAFQEFKNNLLQNSRKPGPKIMRSGGSIPSHDGEIPKDAKGRKSIVAQMLQQAAEQGN